MMEFLTGINELIKYSIDTLSEITFSIGHVKLSLYTVTKCILLLILLFWAVGALVRLTDSRLQRTQMRASSRTLILKIFQILLYCMVIMTALQVLGISFGALNVFGGALGVGLGFGLQKIASNFISGIILLFEKSIETGDLIELTDGTNGFVRQTFARYTLLQTTDGRDVLIPNEEFITQRVTSWTHSNREARVQIDLSVAYDTDLEFVCKLVEEAARNHPKCDKTHEPFCAVTTFGDNGIGLQLLFWVTDVVDGRMGPKSEVMIAIQKAFIAHKISIPFPQREVRVTNALVPVPSDAEKA